MQKLEQSTVIVSNGATNHEVEEWLEQNHGTPRKDKTVKEAEESKKEESSEKHDSAEDNITDGSVVEDIEDMHEGELKEATKEEIASDEDEDEIRDDKTTENETFQDEFDSDAKENEGLEVKPYAGHTSRNSGTKNIF